jgi:hypothetical protein
VLYYLWPLWLYHIFPHYLINRTIFEEKKQLSIKYVFKFPRLLLSFVILRRIQRDVTTDIQIFSRKVIIILVRFERNLYFVDIFSEESSNVRFNENPSRESRVVSCGQTDRQTDGLTDMMKAVVSFRKFGNAPKMCGHPAVC